MRAIRRSAVVAFMAVPQGSGSGYSMCYLSLQVSSNRLSELPNVQGRAMDTLVGEFLILQSFGASAGAAHGEHA